MDALNSEPGIRVNLELTGLAPSVSTMITPVGAARAVHGGGGGVFQDGDAFNLVGIYVRKDISIPSTITSGSAFCKVLIPRMEIVPGTLPGRLVPCCIVTPGMVPENASWSLAMGRVLACFMSIWATEEAT